MFLKDTQVSSFGCFVFEFWVLRFRVLGSSLSRFGCFVFESWVLRFRDLGASCFGLRFRVLRFRNYPSRRIAAICGSIEVSKKFPVRVGVNFFAVFSRDTSE